MIAKQEWIQEFIDNLHICELKSQFDQDFLAATSIDQLCTYTENQWRDLFEKRLVNTFGTDYDWTIPASSQAHVWQDSPQHANYYWYRLAQRLSEKTKQHITKYTFSKIVISSQDRGLLNDPRNYSNAYYNSNRDRLMMLSRILEFINSPDESLVPFASYGDGGKFYPATFLELQQIHNKKDWSYFHSAVIPAWSKKYPKPDIDDLIYPLFGLVTTYFDVLGSGAKVNVIKTLINALYTEELKFLDIDVANYFYGQKIIQAESENLYLIDILLKVMRCENLELVLVEMEYLAIWIMSQNPSMVIDHPMVSHRYQALQIGPHYTLETLNTECLILLGAKYRRELSDNDLSAIQDVIAVIAEPNSSEIEVFQRMVTMFKEKDRHNQIAIHIDIRQDRTVDTPQEYVYYFSGANRQYIRIARILKGLGWLDKYMAPGRGDIWCLLNPSLDSPIDPVSGLPYSSFPFSHLIMPERGDHRDRTRMVVLPNSENYFYSEPDSKKRFFCNVSMHPIEPFTPIEYDRIQVHAAKKFRDYQRIPEYTKQRLNASTLKILVDLVNQSLFYEGLNDGFTLRILTEFPKNYYDKTIYAIWRGNTMLYRVKDSWFPHDIQEGEIAFENKIARQSFLDFSPDKQLTYVLSIAAKKGHARSNLSVSHYYKAYMAYTRCRELYKKLDGAERHRLNQVSMRCGGLTRTFAEIWNNGFPDCMSSASKWFSVLIADYLDALRFDKRIESHSSHSTYLRRARQNSQKLYDHWVNMDLPTEGMDLNDYLTHPSSRNSWIEIVLFSIGFYNEKQALHIVELEHLLSIVDSEVKPDTLPNSVPAKSGSIGDVTDTESTANSRSDTNSDSDESTGGMNEKYLHAMNQHLLFTAIETDFSGRDFQPMIRSNGP